MGLGAVLSQKQNNWWHPISFISRSLGDAEQNYHTADLEMTAVIFALEEWQHYLLDAHIPFEILTDHKNLEYFRKPQDLSRKQARWNQWMQQFHFTFVHRPGKTNPADPLSRRPDFEKGVDDNKQQILLPDSIFQTRQTTIEMKFPNQIKELQSKVEDYIIQDIKSGKESSWNLKDGIVYWKDLIYVPKDDTLQESIIVKNHDHPLAGHPGAKRTKSLMLTKFYWPYLGRDVKKYVEGCDRCQKTKVKRKTMILHPHSVSENPWETISIDIIGPLPESSGKNAILTVVDVFSKMIHLFPVSTEITTLGVAKIYRDHIFKLHGTPKKVISD